MFCLVYRHDSSSNSDRLAKLAGLQEELMAAKAENLELAAANCQLTAKLDILRAQLKEAHNEIRENQFTALALPPGHADVSHVHLANL